jgi:hypothetical protein
MLKGNFGVKQMGEFDDRHEKGEKDQEAEHHLDHALPLSAKQWAA